MSGPTWRLVPANVTGGFVASMVDDGFGTDEAARERFHLSIEASRLESNALLEERWADSLHFFPSFFWWGWSFRYRRAAAEARAKVSDWRAEAAAIRKRLEGM